MLALTKIVNIKKIYVVTRGEYDDYRIVAAFSTYELAEQYMEKHLATKYDPVWIEEYELDKPETT